MILLNVQVVVSQQARGAQDVKMNGTAKGNSNEEHYVGIGSKVYVQFE